MSDNPKRHCASQSSRQDDEVKGFMAAVVDMNASLQRAASQITDAARELHTAKSKTESCRNWANTGTCRYGAACRFAHGDVQSVQSSPVHTAPARKRICPYHKNGHCLKRSLFSQVVTSGHKRPRCDSIYSELGVYSPDSTDWMTRASYFGPLVLISSLSPARVTLTS